MNELQESPDISIIMLAKNGARYIDQVLSRVFGQKTEKSFEVIVIDSGSIDSTLDIVGKYEVRLERIKPAEFGHGRTRNLGARMARGKVLVFLNQDAIPANEYWLENLTLRFQEVDRIAGIYSKHVPHPDCNPLRKREKLNDPTHSPTSTHVKFIENFQEYQNMDPGEKRKLISFESISCAIDKKVWTKYPFKDMEFAEDLEWSKRVMEAGYAIIFEPKSVVEHSHNFYRSFLETVQKHFDEGMFVSRIVGYVVEGKWSSRISFVCTLIKADVSFIIKMEGSSIYKIGWVIKGPFIRMAQMLGYILAHHHQQLPDFLRHRLSLVNRRRTGCKVS